MHRPDRLTHGRPSDAASVAAAASSPRAIPRGRERIEPEREAPTALSAKPAISMRLARAAQWLAHELESAASATNATMQPRAANAAGSGAPIRDAHAARERRTAENLAALLSLYASAAPLCPMPLDIGDLVMTVLPAWKPRAPHHSFELALLGDIPPIVADGERVGQAIDRLLAAVIRLTPAGTTVRVSVRPGQAEPRGGGAQRAPRRGRARAGNACVPRC